MNGLVAPGIARSRCPDRIRTDRRGDTGADRPQLSRLRGGERVEDETLHQPYSDGVAAAVEAVAQVQDLSPDAMKQVIIGKNRTTLLERFLDPTEVADLVAYLASPRASATNGAAVRADGGVLTSML